MLVTNQVHQGDCVEQLANIRPGSVHLSFADPPFNIGYDYDVYDDRKHCQEYLEWSKNWMQGVHRALRDDGTFWLAIGDEYAAELKLIAQNDIGFACRSWVIWYYTFGVNCKNGFSRSHTHLFHFVKDPTQFTFNAENPAIRIPSARQLVYADARANPKGRLPDNTWFFRPQDLPGGLPLQHDTWYFPRVAGTFKEREGFHGCQMPEQLLGRIIRACSNPGDIVLDPFGGSGTTLCVAKKLARQFLGIELSPDYVKHIKQRLQYAQPGDPLDGQEDPSQSAPRTAQGKQRRDRTQPLVVSRDRMPSLAPEVLTGIVEAYTESHQGRPADHVIACPELNRQFASACKARKLPGIPVVWNRALLQTRKRGHLPKIERRISPPRICESVACASEIALQQVTIDTGLSVDSVLCDPDLAQMFDELAGNFAPGHTSFEYRWAALCLRKQLRAAKRAAATLEELDLPKLVLLDNLKFNCSEEKAVYALENSAGQPLYVGATCDLQSRISDIRDLEAWGELDVHGFRVLAAEKRQQMIGMKTVLIQQLQPVLNYRGYLSEVSSAA